MGNTQKQAGHKIRIAKRMDPSEFFCLSNETKAQYIYLYGEFISEIEHPDCYTSLFLIGGFFVEIYLCRYSNQILHILPANDCETKLSYLENLQLGI